MSSGPRLSILIPTQGRESLRRTLRSCINSGLAEGDEIIVIGDGHEPSPELVGRWEFYVCKDYGWDIDKLRGARARFILHDAGHHCWGHCQLNEGMRQATGDYLVFQDDDDEFTPEAFTAMRQAAMSTPGRPLMFRFLTMYRLLVWGHPVIGEGLVAGHGLVVPNAPARLGTWTCRYAGDYDFIRGTVDRWGGDESVVWRQEIVGVARPTEQEKRDGYRIFEMNKVPTV